MCYIGPCLSGPIEKNTNLKKKKWLKNCARLPPNFDNHTFKKIINKKKSNWIWTLKFWYKHPYYLPIGSEKSQNDRIYIKTAIWEFAGVKEKVRKLFSGLFFLCFSADLYGIRSICGAKSYLSFESIPLRVSNAVFRIPLCALVFVLRGGAREYPSQRGARDYPDWR